MKYKRRCWRDTIKINLLHTTFKVLVALKVKVDKQTVDTPFKCPIYCISTSILAFVLQVQYSFALPFQWTCCCSRDTIKIDAVRAINASLFKAFNRNRYPSRPLHPGLAIARCARSCIHPGTDQSDLTLQCLLHVYPHTSRIIATSGGDKWPEVNRPIHLQTRI